MLASVIISSSQSRIQDKSLMVRISTREVFIHHRRFNCMTTDAYAMGLFSWYPYWDAPKRSMFAENLNKDRFKGIDLIRESSSLLNRFIKLRKMEGRVAKNSELCEQRKTPADNRSYYLCSWQWRDFCWWSAGFKSNQNYWSNKRGEWYYCYYCWANKWRKKIGEVNKVCAPNMFSAMFMYASVVRGHGSKQKTKLEG